MSWIPLLNIKCHADTQVMMPSDWLTLTSHYYLRQTLLTSQWFPLITSCCSCSSAPSSRQSAWRGQYTPAGLCARQSGQVVRGECRHTGNSGLWLVNSDTTDLWLVDRFPWPPMLDCDKFPLDNDMCITAQSVRSVGLLVVQNKSRDRVTGLRLVMQDHGTNFWLVYNGFWLVKWSEYWPLIGWQGWCWGLPGVRRGGNGDWGAARQQRQGWVVKPLL